MYLGMYVHDNVVTENKFHAANDHTQSQIGWIFKSKLPMKVSVYIAVDQWIRHYALMYGFQTLLNLLKNLLGRGMRLCYVYKCLTFDLSGGSL